MRERSGATPRRRKTQGNACQDNKIWIWTAVDHFRQGILGWVLGDHSAETFEPLWNVVATWNCYFYVTDGYPVYPGFIPDGDQIISKTYMTRVEGENTRLRHYLARLKRKSGKTPRRRQAQGNACQDSLCYSKSEEMLRHSIRLLIHYLKFWEVPVPPVCNDVNYSRSRFSRIIL